MHLLLLVTTFLVLKECYSDICAEKTCINKCCPATYYVRGRNRCEHNPGLDVTTMPMYDIDVNKTEYLGKLGVKPADNFNFHTTKEFKYYKLNFNKHPYYVIENGTLIHFDETESFSTYTPSYYCVDYYTRWENTSSAPNISVWLKLNVPAENPIKEKMKYGLPVSCVFLFLVLVVYCLLPELRTLGGWVLMAHVASLMMSYILLFSFKIEVGSYSGVQCLAMSLATYFFFLSTFCWMNVMSYDIWWTFRGLVKARIINRRGERFKLKMYCLYGFGVPLAMTVAFWILNVNAKKLKGFVVPDIPVQGCFLEGNIQLLYLYLPICILLICNWIFFILTAFNICRLRRGSKMLRSEDSAATGTASARNSNKQRFIMYLKLSTLMGLSWLLEVVSLLKPELYIFLVSDGYNILIGVVIFVMFICNRKIFTMLKKRFKQQKLGPHQKSTSFHSRSRSTLESDTGSSMPLKPRCTFSFQT